MKCYLFTLHPLAPFYFGSERNFGTGEDSDYFARSRQTPQQTTLLGALRFKLLEAAGKLAPNYGGKLPAEATNWVGSFSFDAGKPNTPGDFKKIGGLTPLFLIDGSGKHYLPGNLDSYGDQPFQLCSRSGRSALIKISEKSTVHKTHLPEWEHHNPKHQREPFWVCEDGSTLFVSKIMEEHHQVGVFKLHGRGKKSREKFLTEDEQKGFFKKTSWSFRDKKIAFACGVWLTDDAAQTLASYLATGSNGITPIGGERSLFRISLSEIPIGLLDNWSNKAFYSSGNQPNLVKIVLVSDSYIDNSLYHLADCACTELKDFRNIRTSSATNNYYGMATKPNDDTSSVRKSGKMNLIAAGSVFFVPKTNLVPFRSTLTDSAKAFRQIGYNHFMEISNNKNISFFKP